MANGTSAAMELRVLINILSQGTALKTLLTQTQQLSQALTALQAKAATAGAATAAAGSMGGVAQAANAVTASATAAARATQAASQGMQAMGAIGHAAATGISSFELAVNKAFTAVKFLTGGFLALQGVRYLKGLADEAARVEVLGTVLRVVAQNSNYTAEQIDAVDKKVQALGITAAASRQALTQFMQARLKLEFAPALARAAQDLAVIAGVNSSDTFRRMVINIQQLDTMGLRFMGIVTDRVAAEQKYKNLHTEITGALNKRQMQEALMLEVLSKAALLEGTYSNAMGDVGKQVQSLQRFTETYRATLGESLLPAYSAIVVEITKTFEKLTILAREFSANKERAQEWADVAKLVVTTISTLIVTIAEHADQILKLAQYYIAFKLIMLGLSAIAGAWAWVARAIEFLNQLRLVTAALQARQISLAVAIQALGQASTKESVRVMMMAQSLGQVTVAAGTAATATGAAATGITATGAAATAATVSVSGLAAAWKLLAASIAIPIIGTVIVKAINAANEEAAKPLLLQAAKARDEVRNMVAPNQMMPRIEVLYDAWKRQNVELVASLKDSSAVWKEFNRQIDAASVKSNIGEMADSLAAAKTELQAATNAQMQLNDEAAKPGAKVNIAEIQAAGDKVTALGKKVQTLRDDMTKAFEKTPMDTSTRAIFTQIDAVATLESELLKVRESRDPSIGRREIADAESRLEVAKKLRDEMIKQHEIRLREGGITNAERIADEKGLISLKARGTLISDQAEALLEARKAVFGEARVFTPEGVTSGRFNVIFGGYQKYLTEAENILKTEGKITTELADQLKEGLTRLGQAAETPLDLSRVQEAVAGIQKFGLPETKALGQRAIDLAVQGVRQATLAIDAPLVAERRARIQEQTDIVIAEQERIQHRVMALEAITGNQLEEQYKQQLISLDEYYRGRMSRVRREGAVELEVLGAKVEQAIALEAAAGRDPRAIAAAEARTAAAREAVVVAQGRIEADLDRIFREREERRRDANRETQSALLGQRAQYGGLAEALAKFNFELETERQKYEALKDPRAAEYLILKQLSGEAEIYRRSREEAHQVELKIEDTFQAQLDLQQQQRDIQATRDRALVQQGLMTDYQARLRSNARAEDAQADNRIRRASEVLKLEENNRFLLEEEAQLRKDLADQSKDSVEIARQAEARLLELRGAITQNEAAIASLDEAYIELGTTIVTYGAELQKEFVDGFANALTQTITDYKNAGAVWVSLSKSIADEIVGVFIKAFTQRLFAKMGLFTFVDTLMNKIFGGGGGGALTTGGGFTAGPAMAAEGGLVRGPGTGTSDSVPALVSAGEHIMPAAKAAQWMPLLEGIRLGKIMPAYALGGAVALQSIAIPPVIPRRYASGGVVVADAGAASVQTNGSGPTNMVVTMHPDTLNMTMREWLEHEVVRQQGRR